MNGSDKEIRKSQDPLSSFGHDLIIKERGEESLQCETSVLSSSWEGPD